MSTISNRHSVLPFVAGTSAPLTGQRLAKIGYKQTEAMTKKGETAPASVFASVPAVAAADIRMAGDRLLPYVRAMLESAQDGIIRSLYEGNRMLSSVSDDDISVDACISFLAAEAAGDRLKRDAVLAWFDSEVAENLSVFLAEMLGFEDLNPDQEKVIAQNVRAYRELIAVLAAGKTILETKQIRGCRKAIGLSAANDRISSKLLERLDTMEKPKTQKYEGMVDIG